MRSCIFAGLLLWAAVLAAVPALGGVPDAGGGYTVPVKLTLISGNEIAVRTQSLCRADINDTPTELVPGTSVIFRGSGNMVVVYVKGETYKQSRAVVDGALACGPGFSRLYEGRFEISSAKGRLSCVCVMDLETYTAGVLACEASGNDPVEALKAMAVCIRSYACSRASVSELCDTSHCQNFKGKTNNRQFTEATQKTKGRILLYNGAPVTAMYCSDCGGVTEQGGKAYLASRRDPVKGLKHISWNYVLPKTRLASALGLGNVTGIKVLECSASGRIKTLSVTDGDAGRSLEISGEKLRAKLGYGNLKSTLFTAAVIERDVVFSGKGYGHGLGLCQASGRQLAAVGWSCDRILAWYYDKTVISDIGAYKNNRH
ncbi:MAG: SpoIID/LytB domain-containing protein [Abditibacteriota bacterium]|nr:SpoIID/LytB domain-containing protein [Abditibacteriota bacterium]